MAAYDETTAAEPPWRKRRELGAALAIVLGLGGYAAFTTLARACARRPSERDCGALVDRWVAHESRARGAADGEATAATERARGLPSYAADVRRCQEGLTAAQVACGLAAEDVDAIEQCLQ
jgi:hypothetical protein